MKGPLPVRVELLEQVFLVEDGLIALYGSADLLVKDADDFFGCLLLKIRKRTARSRDALRERLRVGGWLQRGLELGAGETGKSRKR